MSSVQRRERVPYSAEQMFDLVDDIEAYPHFLHWCRDARVVRREDDVVEATLDVGIAGVHKSFTTRNRLDRPRAISIELVSGPFRRLDGRWTFADSGQGSCEVGLTVDFEVRHSPFGFVFARLFEEIANSQLHAFRRRADKVYG